MKNIKTILILMIFSLMLIPFFASAQADPERGRSNRAAINAETIVNPPAEVEPVILSIQNQAEELLAPAESLVQSVVGLEETVNNFQNQSQDSHANSQGEQRRGMVASAVYEMFRLTEENSELGQKISLIAQSQNQKLLEVEESLEKARNRNQLLVLFFGPDSQSLNLAQNGLIYHQEKINDLKNLLPEITNQENIQLFNEQIKVLDDVQKTLEDKVATELSRFSLLGWLKSLFLG